MEKIAIIGASGHAKVIIDIVLNEKKYELCGLLDDYRKSGEVVMNFPILGKIEELPNIVCKHLITGIVIAIGDNFARSKVAAYIKKTCPDIIFINTIHPSALIAPSVQIGAGTIIAAGSIVGPCCKIGNHCILNTNSSLDHDSTMHDFSSIAPGVITGGNCDIGAYAAIGIGTTLIHKVHIGNNSVIGAASLVISDVEPFVIAYGSPAKTIRTRKEDDRYL